MFNTLTKSRGFGKNVCSINGKPSRPRRRCSCSRCENTHGLSCPITITKIAKDCTINTHNRHSEGALNSPETGRWNATSWCWALRRIWDPILLIGNRWSRHAAAGGSIRNPGETSGQPVFVLFFFFYFCFGVWYSKVTLETNMKSRI